MGKLAFVFSGQGDQFPGMGKDLYEKYPAARQIFDLCDRIRPGTSVQCFTGTEWELKETKNTQPCLFAMELAAARALIDKGWGPDAAAGFSLGEVTAATICGIFDDETGFRLVCKRGELMQSEAEKFDTSMAAIVKLSPEQLQEICNQYPDIYPVNFNCPGQITVSGLSTQMPDFFADVKMAGGRAIPLKVKAAFHSPFMKKAAEAFADELAAVKVKRPAITLYANRTAEPYGDDIISLLSSQICNPIQWEKTIRNMMAAGVDNFIEIGPGHTLTNLIRRINADVKAVTVMEYFAEVEGC